MSVTFSNNIINAFLQSPETLSGEVAEETNVVINVKTV